MSLVPKVRKKKICLLACLAVGTSYDFVEFVWRNAFRFQSWDLETFLIEAPSKRSIRKVIRVLQLSKVLH